MAVLVGVLNGTNLNRDFNFQSPASATITAGVRQNYDNELEVTLNQVDTGMAFVQVTRDNVSPSEVFLVPVRVTQATVVDTSGNGWIIVRIDKDKVLDGSANSVDGTGVATVEKVAALPLDDFYVILATLAGGVITDARSWSRISEYVEPDVVHYDEDAGANDSYAVTINGITELVDGMEVTFKANTANTDAATLNVNGLGAKAIRIRTSDVLVTDDIKSGSIITVRYDADNDWWQMMTPSNDVPPVPVKASQAEAEAGTDDAKYMTPLKTLQAIRAQLPFSWLAGESGDAGDVMSRAEMGVSVANPTLASDTYVNAGSVGTNYNGTTPLEARNTGGAFDQEIYLKFSGWPTLFSADQLETFTLSFNLTYHRDGSANPVVANIKAFPITSAFVAGTVNWSTKPTLGGQIGVLSANGAAVGVKNMTITVPDVETANYIIANGICIKTDANTTRMDSLETGGGTPITITNLEVTSHGEEAFKACALYEGSTNGYLGFAAHDYVVGELVQIFPHGKDANQSGLTVNDKQYISDTPGDISDSPGTNEKEVAVAVNATEIFIKTPY